MSPLRNKSVAVLGASTGAYGAGWAQGELRKVLGAIGARVVEGEVALGHAHEKFGEDGELLDEAALEQLEEVLESLLAEAPVALAHCLVRTLVRNILGPLQTPCKEKRTLLSSPSTLG